MNITEKLMEELSLQKYQVENVIALIDEGNTIPFIARYRKEKTGSMDDEVLRAFYDRLNYLRNLEKRKEEVSSSIISQEKMTEELQKAIENAATLAEVEDIYRPYKQKKRTRAIIAKEKGLEPLAQLIMAGQIDPYEEGEKFIDEEKGVASSEEAVMGASDIIAEAVSDNAVYRKYIRRFTMDTALLVCSNAKDESSVYDMYYEYQEPVLKIPSHRVLAITRGEKEEFLKVNVAVNEESVYRYLFSKEIKEQNEKCRAVIEEAVKDSYKRLISPSIERDVRNELFDTASESAIKIFQLNLKNLLLSPPLKDKVIMGLDPAYRTGCKIAVIDETGKVLDTCVVFPTPPQSKIEEAEKKLLSMIKKYKVDVISIGNGTASKESETFVAEMIKKADREVKYMVVSEAGASVYSASKMGTEEFPDFDVAQRSAVSIARRLMDPLAELVKIDPKSIGVGQYQHDMKQARLSEALSGVVEDCVNSVGVDLNTSSWALLAYISGMNTTIAKNVVAYREENGSFKDRNQLLKVPKLGPKAFTQCAGFLKVTESKNPLDKTTVHPESYEAAEKLLALYKVDISDIGTIKMKELEKMVLSHGEETVAEKIGVGVPTLKDIIKELIKPGRDIRDDLPKPELKSEIMDIKDLKEGMILKGTVRNVIDFGAFVDIGVHQDGLVHISQISDKFIKHPTDALSVGDIVTVKVLLVDLNKKRISLTMKIDK
ncbi:MAG: RNA-binding transcriptional accessory protein [Clostridia bacterium]|nr:RNA-binding transcriptional accessory protein [Clostridia bacterium]